MKIIQSHDGEKAIEILKSGGEIVTITTSTAYRYDPNTNIILYKNKDNANILFEMPKRPIKDFKTSSYSIDSFRMMVERNGFSYVIDGIDGLTEDEVTTLTVEEAVIEIVKGNTLKFSDNTGNVLLYKITKFKHYNELQRKNISEAVTYKEWVKPYTSLETLLLYTNGSWEIYKEPVKTITGVEALEALCRGEILHNIEGKCYDTLIEDGQVYAIIKGKKGVSHLSVKSILEIDWVII